MGEDKIVETRDARLEKSCCHLRGSLESRNGVDGMSIIAEVHDGIVG